MDLTAPSARRVPLTFLLPRKGHPVLGGTHAGESAGVRDALRDAAGEGLHPGRGKAQGATLNGECAVTYVLAHGRVSFAAQLIGWRAV